MLQQQNSFQLMSSELSKGDQRDRAHSSGSGGSRVAGGGHFNSVDKSTSAYSTPNFRTGM